MYTCIEKIFKILGRKEVNKKHTKSVKGIK
jgi:hypothetical protein